ncbi:MAG: DUF58 domain-containing protein [Bacillota bacterium]
MSGLPLWLWLYLAGALLIPGRPLYAVLYVLGGIWLLARLSLQWGLRRLQVERLLSDERLFAGDPLTVRLRFTNPTGAPIPWLQLTESRPAGLAPQPLSAIVSVEAGGRAELSYTLPTYRRGRYAIGPLTWTAGDPFGFARLAGGLQELTPVTVYPKISALPDLGLPARLPMGELATRRRLFEDPAWLAGTRPYSQGDSMKRIHWAATAKAGELVVKQFRHAMLLPGCVCLNLNRAEYDPRLFYAQVELAVSAAASLCHHLVERKQQVALLAAGIDPEEPEATGPVVLPLRQGVQAMAAVLEVLARIEGGATAPFASAVLEQARRLPWGSLLCLVTPRETAEMAALCAGLVRGGQQVLLFVLQGESVRREGYQVWAIRENRAAEVVVG